jgi:hypothetical protein
VDVLFIAAKLTLVVQAEGRGGCMQHHEVGQRRYPTISVEARATRLRKIIGYKSLGEFRAEEIPYLLGLFSLVSHDEKKIAVEYFEERYDGA